MGNTFVGFHHFLLQCNDPFKKDHAAYLQFLMLSPSKRQKVPVRTERWVTVQKKHQDFKACDFLQSAS